MNGEARSQSISSVSDHTDSSLQMQTAMAAHFSWLPRRSGLDRWIT